MRFNFRPMAEADALAISAWHYNGAYRSCDAGQDAEDLVELLDPASWVEVYHAVVDERGELVGHFSFECEADTVILGLGLRPDLTGKGLGLEIVGAGLAFAAERYAPRRFRLSVAAFSRRAGFRAARTFMQRTNGGEFEFVEMARDA